MSDVMFAVLRYVKDQQKLELSVSRCYTIKRFDPRIAAADVNEGISYFNSLSNDPVEINRPIGVLAALQIISSKNNLSHMCSEDLFSLDPLKSLNISYIASDASEAATAKRRTPCRSLASILSLPVGKERVTVTLREDRVRQDGV
jgi:hypothetical protein